MDDKAIEELFELAEEAMDYVSPYFRQKWCMDERLAELKAQFETRATPAGELSGITG